MKRILTALTISLLSVASDSVQSADAPTIASAPEQVSRTASGNSLIPTFSGNGKVLVFASSAKNIATNEDKSLNLQLFRFDLPAGGTALISINQNNEPANAEAASVAISSNANQIVFASRANNLVPNDTNQASDIFLWEASNSNPRLVSVAVDGTSSAANPSPLASRPLSENPKLSEHGRRVVFESYSTNLVANPKDPARRDIFARDLSSNITTLVSINTNGTGANADVRLPVVSPDGRFVSFVSSATDLVPVEIPHGEHLFVRDLENGTTTWLSRDLLTMGEYTNTPPGYRFVDHAMSADGKIFAYKITHPSTPQVWVYRYDLNEDATLLLSLGSFDRSAPQLSPDGRFTAYEDGSSIYVWDQLLNSNILVTVSSTGSTPANGVSQTPALSRDGRYVAFVSSASDLVMNTANGLFQVFLRDLQSGTTRLLSRSTNGVAANAGHEFVVPALAPDGSSVAFESDATNLVDNDGNNSSDIFLYDVSTETLRVVSESNSAKPATSRPQPSGIVRGALSADGAWLAFFGYPVSEPTNKHSDLFIRNLATGTNVDISLVTNSVSNAEISADGRYAIVNRRLGGVSAAVHHDDLFRYDRVGGTFQTVHQGGETQSPGAGAHSLSSDGQIVAYEYSTVGRSDVYVRDYTANTNYPVSQRSDGSLAGVKAPLLSPDDKKLLFLATFQGTSHVFLKKLDQSNEPVLVSHSVSGSDPLTGSAKAIAISGNSQIAAFSWLAAGPGIYQYNIASNSVSVACNACQNPSLDFSGLLIAYESLDVNGRRSVALRDLQTSQVTLLSDTVSLGLAPGTPAESWSPLITPDARIILFLSRDASSPTNVSRLYLRDRALGHTLLLTPNSDGIGLISRDGARLGVSRDSHTAVFRSFGNDLVAGDYNDSRDVFVIHLGSGDSDGDGMDDDWELAYFGNLLRDGSGDYDQDGQSDLQEFRAGTDPTNNGSVLRAITVTQLSGRATVFWNAVAGRSYRVEFKQNVDDPGWTTVSGQIQINGSTGSIEDTGATSDSHRFYRVVAIR